MNLIAGALSIGGNLVDVIGNNDGGSILGNTALFVTSLGDITTGGEADFIIDNSAFSSAGFITGGENTGSATIQLDSQSVSTGGGLFTFLSNDGGGHIGADALVRCCNFWRSHNRKRSFLRRPKFRRHER